MAETTEVKVTYLYMDTGKEYFYEEKTGRIWNFKTRRYVGTIYWNDDDDNHKDNGKITINFKKKENT
jgi:hypothetical protein